MHRSFNSMEALLAHLHEDKECQGAEAALRNRFPVRWLLFEHFSDFNEFVLNCPEKVFRFAIDKMLLMTHPDLLPTSTEVSRVIADYVAHLPANDYVVFPFSELGRFYAEDEFLALVKTIKGVEPPADAQAEHTRVYIPVVGMQGKMSRFFNDAQAYVWEFKSSAPGGVYRVLLTPGTTYSVQGLERNHTVVRNLQEWLTLWKRGAQVRRDIVCASQSIFLNAPHAQPDNALCYVVCHNAHEFLTMGLGLDFGEAPAGEDDMPMWERMAGMVDTEDFCLRRFVNERMDTYNLCSGRDFVKTWLECKGDFDRWLLALYYKGAAHGLGYVCEALGHCTHLSTADLFSAIATGVFEGPHSDEDIQARREALAIAAKHRVKITELAERKVHNGLSALLVGTPEQRCLAKKLMTDFTPSERRLAIEAYGKGLLDHADLRDIFPDLHHYLGKLPLQPPPANGWVADYFQAYRQAKVAGGNEPVLPLLRERNASRAAFCEWYDGFKTVKTLLNQRGDIDVFYWIDGLGVDWLPFIAQLIEEHRGEHVFLNEVYVARAALPTTTAVNKPQLEALLPQGGKLEKIGDLDSFAHQHKQDTPGALLEEMRIVRKAVSYVLAGYNGKKIAFVSDHGLSYMAQYGKGLNLAGVKDDHEGRVAHILKKAPSTDSKYLALEDGTTLCALTHDSLTSKTPTGRGAHGGATPEEALVPIIIVSGQENASAYSAQLIDNEIDGTHPVLRLRIKGLSSIDVPLLEYNGATYDLVPEPTGTFVSERLHLVDTATRVTLRIGQFRQGFNIKVSTGAEEEDPFGDL